MQKNNLFVKIKLQVKFNKERRLFFMRKLYNTYDNLSSNLSKFIKFVYSKISKPHLKLIPHIIIGMIQAESVVTNNIIRKVSSAFFDISFNSITRRFERFFNNSKFDIYSLFDSIIIHIISFYKLKNKNVYISFDHMFCRDAFTVLLFSLRIGKQGIPLWFRCFKGKKDPEAFKTSLIISGIDYIHSLFSNKKCNLIFLADRWFQNNKIMHHINSINCTFYIRAKSSTTIRIDNYPDADLINSINDIPVFYSKSSFFDSVYITKDNFHTKLTISKSYSHKEPFYILTNGNTRDAIKHYSKRFGSIEFIFKSQKSNGFHLESSKVRNITAFSTLYGLMCIAFLWISILGSDYSKNQNHFKQPFKFRTSKSNR